MLEAYKDDPGTVEHCEPDILGSDNEIAYDYKEPFDLGIQFAYTEEE